MRNMRNIYVSFQKTGKILVVFLLVLFATFRYFYMLQEQGCFMDDEYQTEGVAEGYLKTGTFYLWDWEHNCISDISYTRAWPYTIILANWIRLFGTSEYSCRSLSAVLGVVFVISFIFISYNLFHNIYLTFFATIFLLMNSTISYYFRFTRMYALAMFLSIWLFFCIYKALANHNVLLSDNVLMRIPLLKLLDFDMRYAGASLVLLFLSYHIHVNICIIILGVAFYVLCKCLTDKTDKRYLYWGMIIVIMFLIVKINIVFYRNEGEFLYIKNIMGYLAEFVAPFKQIQPAYFDFVWAMAGSKLIATVGTIPCITCIAANCIRKKHTQESQVAGYCLCLNITTIIFFVFFTTRYYSAKYIMMILPFTALVFAFGLELIAKMHKILRLVITLWVIVLFGINIHGFMADEVSISKTDYIGAYSTISTFYDIQNDTIPIVGKFMRTYYSSQILNNCVYAEFDRKSDMDILLEFSKEYPEGIITCEDIKLGGLKQGMPDFFLNWSDNLSGQQIDGSGVEVSHYLFIDQYGWSDQIAEQISGTAGPVSKCMLDNNEVLLYLDTTILAETAQVIFLRLQFETETGVITRCVQLRIAELTDTRYAVYLVSAKDLVGIDHVLSCQLDSEYAIYAGGKFEAF